MKSTGSSPRGMSDKDLDEFYAQSGKLTDFTPYVEEMFMSFMGYLTTREDFVIGMKTEPGEVLKHYGKWRKDIWPVAKTAYERSRKNREEGKRQVENVIKVNCPSTWVDPVTGTEIHHTGNEPGYIPGHYVPKKSITRKQLNGKAAVSKIVYAGPTPAFRTKLL